MRKKSQYAHICFSNLVMSFLLDIFASSLKKYWAQLVTTYQNSAEKLKEKEAPQTLITWSFGTSQKDSLQTTNIQIAVP